MARRTELGALSLGGRIIVRHLRSAPGIVAMVFVALFSTSGFITAAPRVMEKVAREDLHRTLVTAEPEQRNISAETQGRIATGPHGDPLSNVEGHGDRLLADDFPTSVGEVIGDTRFVVESPSFRVTSFPEDQAGPFPTTFRFRYQDGLEERTTLVSGSMPGSADPVRVLVGDDCPTDRLAVDGFHTSPGADCVVGEIPVLETALTEETAAALGIGSGDSILVRPEGQERLWYMHGIPDETQTWVVRISGIVELSDPTDDFWYADTALHQPRIVENPDFRLIFAQGLMTADLYGEVLAAAPTAGFDYTWRFFVDPDRVDASRAERLIADIGEIPPAVDEDLITFLPELLTAHLGQRSVTVALMSVAGASLLLVAIGVMVVLAGLYAARRERSIALTRDRGASFGQLTLTSAYTGVLLVVPATTLGYLATRLTAEDTDSLLPGRGAFLLAIGGVAAFVAAMTPIARRRLLDLRREDQADRGSMGRRVVLEVFMVTAALASVAVLRRRGLADAIGPGADPLLAVTPAVVGITVGLLTVRLLGPLTRFISSVRRRPSLVGYLGLRRVMSLPAASRPPIVVIVAAVGLAVLSSTVQSSIADAQHSHTWQVVGADVRLEGRDPGSPPTIDVEALGQGRASAEGVVFPDTLVIGRGGAPRVTVLAVDVAAYRDVLAGSGADAEVVDALETIGRDPGTTPAPVIISDDWGTDPPRPGTPISLDLGAVDPDLEVVATLERFPSLDPGEPFAVMSLETLRSIRGELDLLPTVVFIRTSEASVAEIAASVEEMDGQARAVSRYRVAEDLAGDPFTSWSQRGLTAVFYLATGFAVLTGLALFAATAWHRRRDLGLLRTLGVTTRQTTAITALEQGIPVTVATVLGGLTGAIVAIVLTPALNIGAFTGGTVPAQLAVDWASVLLVVAAIALVTAVVLSAVARMTKSTDQVTSLRLGDE